MRYNNAPNGTRDEYVTPDPEPTRLTDGLDPGPGPAGTESDPGANYAESAIAKKLTE